MYANVKSGTISETNKTLYVNYTSIKKKRIILPINLISKYIYILLE